MHLHVRPRNRAHASQRHSDGRGNMRVWTVGSGASHGGRARSEARDAHLVGRRWGSGRTVAESDESRQRERCKWVCGWLDTGVGRQVGRGGQAKSRAVCRRQPSSLVKVERRERRYSSSRGQNKSTRESEDEQDRDGSYAHGGNFREKSRHAEAPPRRISQHLGRVRGGTRSHTRGNQGRGRCLCGAEDVAARCALAGGGGRVDGVQIALQHDEQLRAPALLAEGALAVHDLQTCPPQAP
eukprot:1966365-Pleurochrysis_carterae.AAC.1